MRQSQLFTKTRKDAPKDEISKNAELLIRAGFVHKEMAGVYAYLPLGLKVLNKIEGIIREEMDRVGGQELQLTALQDKALWEKTDRWDDEKVDNWFKTEIKAGGEAGLAITHEEPLTRIMSEYVSSYRDLPVYAYQFQTKFRNEMRAKSGIMRGREFLMKDLYSFSQDEESHKDFYDKVREAYKTIFKRVGLGEFTYVTFASGGIFSKFSEEFQAVSDAGEDLIYLDEEKGIAVNQEVLNDEVLSELGLDRSKLVEKKAIEVGNIFSLGAKFSEPLNLKFKTESGELKSVIMGSYGIGLGRLMGTVVEVLADEKGIVWPETIAPYRFHLLAISESEEVGKFADEVYEKLTGIGVDVLYDDRDLMPGEKFNDADLVGIPTQIIVGKKAIESKMIEIKNRKTGEIELKSLEDVLRALR